MCHYIAGIDELVKVMEAVHDVSQWFDLGLALGLKQPTLQCIIDQCKPSDHKREMLTKWLNHTDGCHPSWEALLKALRSPIVQSNDVASKIEQDHKSLGFHN